MNILFVIPDARGHLNPSMSLACELKNRGHACTFVGRLDSQELVEENGFGFVSIGEKEFPIGSTPELMKQLGQAKGMKAVNLTIQFYLDSTRSLLNELPSLIEKIQPDLLLVDQTYRMAKSVAEKYQIPFFTLCNALDLTPDIDHPPSAFPFHYKKGLWQRIRNRILYSLLFRKLKPILAEIDQWRQKHGLSSEAHLLITNSPHLVLSQQVDAFDLPRNRLANIQNVGPFVGDDRKHTFDGFPEGDFIYASLGTVQNGILETYKWVAEVCHELRIPLIIGAGGSTKILEHKFSGKPLVLEYAPQLAILSRAKLVITHAGMNTCMETLKFGKPMVAVPVTNDQPGVGARIEYHGCGKTIFLGNMSKSKLKQAVEKVWRNKSYSEKAHFFRVEIRKAGGSPRAADLIEETFARLSPEMPQRRFESEEPQSNPHA